MHVQEFRGSGALVEVIDVLGDVEKGAWPFALQFHQSLMGGIRLHGFQTSTSEIVEALYDLRLLFKSLRRGDVIDAMSFPESIAAPERSDAGLCGESGAGKNDEAGVCEPGHDW
jgi:hypothetical protein